MGAYSGLKQKGIDTLMDCVKACASAGGGIAPEPAKAADTPQLCFGIDYDFSDHSCFFHVNIAICGGIASTLALPITPVNVFANPSNVNILMCKLSFVISYRTNCSCYVIFSYQLF